MPVIYRCRVCGYVLYVFERVGQSSYGVPTPSELISMYGSACPRCGRPLEPPRLRDIVVVADRRAVEARIERLRAEAEGRAAVSAKLPVGLVEVLDSVAEKLGVSRSEALRLAVVRLAGEING